MGVSQLNPRLYLEVDGVDCEAEAHGDVNVNPALTNVSHQVKHLSFGMQDAKGWAVRLDLSVHMPI